MPICAKCGQPYSGTCRCKGVFSPKIGQVIKRCSQPEKQPARIRVLVTDDEGAYVPNVGVEMDGVENSTDIEGVAIWDNVTPGTHTVELNHDTIEALKTYDDPGQTTRKICVPEGKREYVFYVLTRKGGVNVRVFWTDENGQRQPVTNAAVRLNMTKSLPPSQFRGIYPAQSPKAESKLTAPDGTAKFKILEPGKCTVTFEDDQQFWVDNAARTRELHISDPGEEAKEIEIEVFRKVPLVVKVVADGGQGRLFAGSTVVVTDGPQLKGTQKTSDKNGCANFGFVAPGKYKFDVTLSVEDQKHYVFTQGGGLPHKPKEGQPPLKPMTFMANQITSTMPFILATTVATATVQQNAAKTLATVLVKPLPSLKVRAVQHVDGAAIPVPGATVVVTGPMPTDLSARQEQQQDTVADFGHVMHGVYLVTASAENLWAREKMVVLPPGEDQLIDLDMMSIDMTLIKELTPLRKMYQPDDEKRSADQKRIEADLQREFDELKKNAGSTEAIIFEALTGLHMDPQKRDPAVYCKGALSKLASTASEYGGSALKKISPGDAITIYAYTEETLCQQIQKVGRTGHSCNWEGWSKEFQEVAPKMGAYVAPEHRDKPSEKEEEAERVRRIKTITELAAAALKKLPSPAPSITSERYEKVWPGSENRYVVGNQFKLEAFYSTGIGFTATHADAKYRIYVTGKSGRNVMMLSDQPKEAEILYPPETKFKVVDRREEGELDNAYTSIFLEEID